MRRRMMAMAVFSLIVLSVPGWTQQDEARITVDFRGEAVGQVLTMFARGYGLEYTFGSLVDPETPIFATLVDVPLDNALTVILQPAGLTAVDQNGQWLITPQPEPVERAALQTRSLFTTDSDKQPLSTRRAMPGYEPRLGQAEEDDAAAEDEERAEIVELLYPEWFAGDVLSEVFGGGIVEAGGYYGSGGSYNSGTSTNYNNSRDSNNWSNTSRSGSNRPSGTTWDNSNY